MASGPADHPFGARAAISLVAAGFEPLPAVADAADDGDGPLDWPGYARDRARARTDSGEDESVLCGTARIGAHAVVVISFDFRYIGGSVGERAGALICQALAEARRRHCPVVSLIATGGSRMQEGMRSLRQLQRIAAECARNAEIGVPHVAVLRNPTAGGLWASLGAGADVVVALQGATVAFAGRRVRGDLHDTDDFRAEGKYGTGQVDLLVSPADARGVVTDLVDLLAPAAGRRRAGGVPAPVPRALGRTDLPPDGWSAVRRARDADRPRARAYLDDYFDVRVAISGDRAGGVDTGMLCGIGRRDGRTVAYAAQTGTANTPAGFRTATRLVHLADRLGIPVLTLIDTPGAANDESAERAGVGPAIAGLFAAIAGARVPVTTLVIGEGGSGGALALASPDRLWITPDGYFSVIAPHAAAAILKRAETDAPALAAQFRLRPQDLLEDALVRGIAGATVVCPTRSESRSVTGTSHVPGLPDKTVVASTY
ncbi:carboxyl transferase domain-containing protein [Micromonospora inositola]|uniref:Acetyl-coenzyme A carboxylase carboxyl transferase subunits beta/alpha n=1 Tax=Micromonospora inositola TaxID=47865 RepID=A0A1C5K5A8_9ACTN|nr:carboxyl transferase domain-containing protein [Micromonospora inositola]SCG77973.1 acetyl-CoA carboxylase carboxyl transferase subunit beta [Micromonospora inositola]